MEKSPITTYTQSEITSDFDKLSLLSEGTPKERLTGYSINPPPRRDFDDPNYVRRVRLSNYAGESTVGFQHNDSTVTTRLSPVMLGKGRGKILCTPQKEVTNRCELDNELESQIRLATPLGYSNELIEQHFAHHLKEQPSVPIALPVENLAPIPPNNVALLSLSRGAMKRAKKISTSSDFNLNSENFPELK